ncbi:MAG: helix-turn-helix transcriptional regulator [Lewinellaceae bacterium]|nr:helix-turn-helix transcriptional regulator [Lewinellaceae bacterium]
MKPLPKIARILEIKPFKITLLWNTSEIRLSDFAPLFEQWEAEGDSKMATLRDWETFKQVAVSENRTLCWPNIPVSFTFKGETRTSPLELDALELYRQSILVKKTEPVNVGAMLREAREAAGLSQADVALKSGTTRNYISRIENDKSDIQLETLQKIVELGIGGEIVVQIKPGKVTKHGNFIPAKQNGKNPTDAQKRR